MGLGAALLAMQWLEQQRGLSEPVATMPDAKMRTVVVAGQPLRFGSELSSVNLKEVTWPVGAVPSGSFSHLAELTKPGERRVALAAIERDEPVLAWKVTGPGQRATLSAVIEAEKKAVTIRVNDVSGTAGFVLPGDRVDVLLTRNEDKAGFTEVLLQNVRALAIDQLADERAERPSVAKAVTLEVTTEQAQKLALAQTVGQLSLALRPAGATAWMATRRVGVSDLTDFEPPIPVPQKAVLRAPIAAVIGITRAMERQEYRVRPESRGREED
jgi:pilus assembly protein CpaB